MSPERLRWFAPATTLLLAWGALAFGAEYPWAYAPLLVFCTTIGLVGLLAVRGRQESRTAFAAVAAVFSAGALQVVPLPERVLTLLSPARLEHDFAALHAAATMSAPPADSAAGASLHAISIAPSRTLLALTFLAALSVFFLACVRALSVVRASVVARCLVGLGAVVALVAIAQEASGSLRVYGVWFPRKAWQPAAPFINENHLAGWLTMTFALSAGYLRGGLSHGRVGQARGWRDRVVRFASRGANERLLVAFAALVMLVAVFLTGSVSGMVCLVAASWALAVLVWRRNRAANRAAVVPVVLLLAPAVAALWAGLDMVSREAAETLSTALDVEGRVGLWRDTLGMIGDFPLTGVGLNCYGVAMLAYQTHDVGMRAVEAHNDYLQLLAEGGVLLALPVAFAVVAFVQAVRRRFRESGDDSRIWWLRTGAVVGICGLALQSAVDFSLQMPGSAVLFVLLMAVAVHRPPPRRRRRS